MRQLATIQKIKEISAIEGADKLELATVLGWQCVVEKGLYKVGDLVVYCEIDSVLPERPEFEWLRKGNFVDNKVVKGFRIKTRKFRGQFSQGLILPLSILNGKKYKEDVRENPVYNWKEGQAVDVLLDIVKFERPIPANLQGKVKGLFPTFIPKTDETRVQVLQALLTTYKDTECYITEKVDGTSCTMYYNNGVFGVCSRNLELAQDDRTYHESPALVKVGDKIYKANENGEAFGEPITELPNPTENVYWKMAREYDVENKLKTLGFNVAIQGEIFGNGIQKNPLKVPYQKYVLFNIFNIDKQEYLPMEDLLEFSRKVRFEVVPIINDNYKLSDNIQELVELSKGNSVINPERKREGIVIRPIESIVNAKWSSECQAGRISFKAINPEYLVANDE